MEQEKSPIYKERDAAIQAAIDANVTIWLEKKAGSELFHRKVEASSASAAVNGLAVLVKEYAAMLGVSAVQVLALLATVLTVPYMEAEEAPEN